MGLLHSRWKREPLIIGVDKLHTMCEVLDAVPAVPLWPVSLPFDQIFEVAAHLSTVCDAFHLILVWILLWKLHFDGRRFIIDRRTMERIFANWGRFQLRYGYDRMDLHRVWQLQFISQMANLPEDLKWTCSLIRELPVGDIR